MAAPLNGATRVWEGPPATVPACVMTPVAGLSHSTLSVPVTARRSMLTLPALGTYTRYWNPGLAKQ